MSATAVLPEQPTAEDEQGRSARRAAMLTAAVGAAHAILFLLAFWLMSHGPGAGGSDDEIKAFYENGGERRLILVGLYVMPFAGISFIWFIVALRMWIERSRQRENVLLSNIQLVCGILYVGLFFTAGAASAAVAATIEFTEGPVDPVIARQLPQFGTTILVVFAMRMAAMFVFTTSGIARSLGILPRWFTFGGYGIGVFLLLSITFTGGLVLVFPAWLLILCALILKRARQIPADALLPATIPAVNQPLISQFEDQLE